MFKFFFTATDCGSGIGSDNEWVIRREDQKQIMPFSSVKNRAVWPFTMIASIQPEAVFRIYLANPFPY